MEFAAIPWVQGSLVTLALAVIASACWLVFKGLLVPQRTHDSFVAVLELRITEKAVEVENYKVAWQAAEAARREQDGQLSELLEYARTTDQVIRALGRRGSRDALAP
ncbi:hypothetical protein FHR32_005139 [Streptosporangium album]|uniref:Uncharacterized protein n=1 Tax=Streptosporangium album TaxID=47479 RepID=A0A7W7RZF8_9ACTN|nr:hypothetical protein [Streptosporangium album]MBB4940762.1 hypothetical protein [Streptosporangium album]